MEKVVFEISYSFQTYKKNQERTPKKDDKSTKKAPTTPRAHYHSTNNSLFTHARTLARSFVRALEKSEEGHHTRSFPHTC